MSTQNKLLLFFIMLLILFFSVSETWMLFYGLKKTKEEWHAQNGINVNTILDLQKQGVAVVALALANNPTVKAAYRENNPQMIIDAVLPFWKQVHTQDMIYEIHFFKPPAISFVNFSNVGSIGTNVSRVRRDMVWVTSSFKASSHLMMCKTYAGVRATYPIVDANGTMLGGLSLGKKVGWIPATLKDTSSKEAFLVYTKAPTQNLSEHYYQQFMEGKEALGDYIFAQRTLPISKAEFSGIDFSKPQQSFETGGREYELDLYPLYDFNHDVMAYIGVLNSLDAFSTRLWTRLLTNLLLVGSTFAVLFLLFRKRVRKTFALISQMKTLTQHFKNNRFDPLKGYDLERLEAQKGQDEIRGLQLDILQMGRALQSYHDEMQSTVEEKTAALSRANRELEHRLYSDHLTGLPNRNALFRDAPHWPSPAVATIDINGFKTINDLYGVELGNRLLKELGSFCQAFLADEPITVYRISADEFVLAAAEGYEEAAFTGLVVRLIAAAEKHRFIVENADLELYIELVAGIAFGHGKLIEKADMALVYAKKTRRDYVVYTDALGLDRAHEESIALMRRLKQAVEGGHITVVYQPIVDREGTVKKYESLLRIREGDTLLSPHSFLAFAKKTRYYKLMTRAVVDKTFAYFAGTSMQFTINLTAQDILDSDTVAYLYGKLEQSGLARNVVFEIVESESLQGMDAFETFVEAVKNRGAKVAIDDFGSGYSNFSYLLKLAPDYLKIDGSLIKEIHTDANAYAIVQTIVGFAKTLGIRTIAEYIHSEAVFDVCKTLGIDEFQGYYFGAPEKEIPDVET
ncbi:EAL domain-containing protein [Sulfurimonas sp. HSL-1656]|uniref:EAL domain-containing protein n=1 Tax=Thiomicrolovo subterrani TaxID=3131934 RepID=UPI0031F75305